MDFLDSLSGVLSVVLGITTVVAGGLVGLQIGSVRTLRSSNGDLRERVADLEKGRADDRAKNARLTADLDALGRVVTGETHLVALTHQLDDHHTEARTHWLRDETVLEQILEAIKRQESHP